MAASQERAKEAAARVVAAQVRPASQVALGTGSTAALAIRALAARFPGKGTIRCVASSPASERLAREVGLELRALGEGDRFDVMIDGADEVSPALDLTKGGGGALLREKLLARHSRELLIAVDDSKPVGHLGERSPIPVEIVPFARPALLDALRAARLAPTLRQRADGSVYVTDNGNEILDLRPAEPLTDPGALELELRRLTGVVETGLFVGFGPRVFVGHPDGSVEELRRRER